MPPPALLRVTCVEPGMAAGTEFSLVRFDGAKDGVAAFYAGSQPLMPDDIAESVYWAATVPAHVNINTSELMPVRRSFAPPFRSLPPPPPETTSGQDLGAPACRPASAWSL
jgi:3-hydroxy acid dehydrogenase/malonic semialdehyde reductase